MDQNSIQYRNLILTKTDQIQTIKYTAYSVTVSNIFSDQTFKTFGRWR